MRMPQFLLAALFAVPAPTQVLGIRDDVAQAPTASAPGIARVGKTRAARMWADVRTTPGMKRWSCEEGVCTVMFDPGYWVRMDYDLKEDFTAMMGIAFAYGKQADFTEIRDMMTNRKLASYSSRRDRVRIE